MEEQTAPTFLLKTNLVPYRPFAGIVKTDIEARIFLGPAAKAPECLFCQIIPPYFKILLEDTGFLVLAVNRIKRHPSAAEIRCHGIIVKEDFTGTGTVFPDCAAKSRRKRNIHGTVLLSNMSPPSGHGGFAGTYEKT